MLETSLFFPCLANASLPLSPQEREELQREGDVLDAKIRKAEKEVTALEQTMIQLVTANGSFGSTFKKVDSATSVAERATLRCARAPCDLLAKVCKGSL